MKMPDPGSPVRIDDETRIAAVDCKRLGRLYQVECKFGPVNWQAHGGPHEDYAAALEQANRVMRRPRSERPESPMMVPQFKWPGPEPWTEARHPEGQYDMQTLGGRVRRARARAGLRT